MRRSAAATALLVRTTASASLPTGSRRLFLKNAAVATARAAGQQRLSISPASALALLRPPALSTGQRRRLSVDSYSSSGVIIDPYLDHHRREQAAQAAPFYSVDALRAKWDGVKSKLTSGVSFAHIGRHVKSFKLRGFSKTANELFVDMHEAFEKGDTRRLAALCTEDLFLNLKSQIKMKRDKPSRRVLRFISFTQPTIVVHGRHLYASGTRGLRTQTGYGQITVLVSSRREEFDVDAKGNRIVSSPSSSASIRTRPPAIFDNESICVLEVSFADPKGRWRLASIVEEPRKTDAVASSFATEPVGL